MAGLVTWATGGLKSGEVGWKVRGLNVRVMSRAGLS